MSLTQTGLPNGIRLYKPIKPHTKITLINECLKQRLYVPGWSLKWYLRDQDVDKIVVAKENQNLIGIAVTRLSTNQVAVYVKPQYRKQGIGTKLVKQIASRTTHYALLGEAGSASFWKKIDINVGMCF